MPEETTKHLSKFRTFAGDLEEQKMEREQASSKKKKRKKKHKKNKPRAHTPEPKKAPPTETKQKTPQKKEEVIHVVEKPKVEPKAEPKTEPAVKKQPEKKSTPPKKIPAFHELRKQAKAAEGKSSGPKMSDLSASDTTIITDTKSGNFKLFPSIISSIKSWFKKVTTSKMKRAPKYTVAKTSHRKGVIQKATSKSGSIFTADSETIKEQIRRRQQQDEDKPKVEDEPETIWSPYTDIGYELLEAPEEEKPNVTANVKVEFKKKAAVISEPITPVVPEPIKEPEPVAPPAPPVTEPEPEPEKIVPVQELESEGTEFEMEEDDTEEETEDYVPRTANEYLDTLQKTNTNTLTIITSLSIIALIILFFVSKVLFQYVTDTTNGPNVTEIKPPESILVDTNLQTITIDASTAGRLSDMIDGYVETTSSGITEIAVVSQSGGEATPSYVFELLTLKPLASLKQSLTSIRFVTADNAEEAILLKFVDEGSVRGGFLYWEDTLIEDLDSLYNLPTKIYSEFTDEKIADQDIRIIRDENGVVLLYSILNDTTALIATDIDLFTKIVEVGL